MKGLDVLAFFMCKVNENKVVNRLLRKNGHTEIGETDGVLGSDAHLAFSPYLSTFTF
jgi:hypothetical protein